MSGTKIGPRRPGTQPECTLYHFRLLTNGPGRHGTVPRLIQATTEARGRAPPVFHLHPLASSPGSTKRPDEIRRVTPSVGSIGGRRIGRENAMKKSLVLILLPLMLAALPRAHGAEVRACLDRSVMVDTLITEYGEQLAEVREIKDTGLLEFHVSSDVGSWTAVLTSSEGISCVLATGQGLESKKSYIVEVGREI